MNIKKEITTNLILDSVEKKDEQYHLFFIFKTKNALSAEIVLSETFETIKTTLNSNTKDLNQFSKLFNEHKNFIIETIESMEKLNQINIIASELFKNAKQIEGKAKIALEKAFEEVGKDKSTLKNRK